jgi:hypothetical protein
LHGGHLARRLATSLSRREPAVVDAAWAESYLLGAEVQLWRRLDAQDRRHAITVARRFEAIGRTAAMAWSREEMAGALLHDVGKLDSHLGTVARVVATLVGPRTERFRSYHDHEQIGADLLAHAGSSPITADLVSGHGRAAAALAAADQI